MNTPITWTKEQLDADRLEAIARFRHERLEEPLEDYLEAFDAYQGYVEELLETTVDLSELDATGLEILTNPKLLQVFRYLAGPPISEDDLSVLSEATSLAPTRLRENPADVQRLVDVVKVVLDRRRFAWVAEQREPTEAERSAAVMASAALLATSRAQTLRRSSGKDIQEQMVKDALTVLGYVEVRPRRIPNVVMGPDAGEFCGESVLGNRKADLVVRLRDQRLLPIECKVSNSSLNSVKRLNNDAAIKAVAWRTDFGLRQVVPTAVLGGVYDLHNLEDAQTRGLMLIWAHNLAALTEWIGKD